MNRKIVNETGTVSAGQSTLLHNGKRIQQILEIERQAQAIHEAATREAEQLLLQAEREAQALIEAARANAQTEARQLLENAQAHEECAHILNQAEEASHRMEVLALSHFDHAVGYVLDRVGSRE